MITDALGTVKDILNSVVPLLVSVGVVYFVWGVVAYVIGGGEEAKKKGRDKIIYGIIGLAVIVSVWGLVNLLTNTFNLNNPPTPTSTSSTGCDTSTGLLDSSIAREKKLQHIVCYITSTIQNSVIPLLFAVALATFVWGVLKFFFINSDEEAKRTQGKQFMIWGIIALAVMLSVWGLVSILGGTFGIDVGSGALKGLPQTKECDTQIDPNGGQGTSNCT